MTLTDWFRFYVFNPLTRRLRSLRVELPTWTIIIIGQLTTMIMIGMWHGIASNFVLWGVWHGLGLFLHNRWTILQQKFASRLNTRIDHRLRRAISIFLTFNYITLGWVWFAIPNVDTASDVLQRLVGM
jgi:alginate O-acetyltransferase complex protein AlgI